MVVSFTSLVDPQSSFSTRNYYRNDPVSQTAFWASFVGLRDLPQFEVADFGDAVVE